MFKLKGWKTTPLLLARMRSPLIGILNNKKQSRAEHGRRRLPETGLNRCGVG